MTHQTATAPEFQRLDQRALGLWIVKHAKAGKNQCCMFVLSHDDGAGKHRAITRFVVPKKVAVENVAVMMEGVAEFDRASWHFAAIYHDRQRFLVGAYLRDSQGDCPIAEWPFNVTPSSDVRRSA